MIILTYGVISFLSLAEVEAFDGDEVELKDVSVACKEEVVSLSFRKYFAWLLVLSVEYGRPRDTVLLDILEREECLATSWLVVIFRG